MVTTSPLQGMRDFLPLEVRQRKYLIGAFQSVYERYGFEPIETPLLERLEVLLGKGGDENEKLIFKALKRGAALERAIEAREELADAGLRFDLTVPLARYYMEHKEQLGRPFRRYHIGPVFRADRPGRGRFREFFQCDVDVLGVAEATAEVEVLLATTDALDSVGFSGFSVRLNDRRLLKAVLAHLGVPEELQPTAVIALDKLDKVGLEGVQAELLERGINQAAADKLALLDAPALAQLPVREALSQVAERLGLEPAAPELASLHAIIEDLEGVRGGRLELSLDPLLARGMGYYTGPIFEVWVKGVPFSLAGGGRYDGLLARFGKEVVPAVGFSIGFERIVGLLEEQHKFPAELARLDVFVTVFGQSERIHSLRLADALRAHGYLVATSLRLGSLKPQLREANDRCTSFVAILGPEECLREEVQFKHLASGQSFQVPIAGAPEALSRLVAEVGSKQA
jgi:histidyl-tRNA synthetase